MFSKKYYSQYLSQSIFNLTSTFQQTMVQQLRECAFKDLQVTTKKDVHTPCTIIEKSTCVSVVEIFVTLLLESLHFL